ncbi:hypothetical protein [Chengkuizengella marina]|uniref:Uncharacterized protein n=1 Tax=Chengkuizengella marina TaxID=2507566 RepID=A0A6N9Q299_9BACL|nr:hypothetical protein [Chengkuizengella marina]NBI28634.1 hypothetical protein [Chengkuizengella marina]
MEVIERRYIQDLYKTEIYKSDLYYIYLTDLKTNIKLEIGRYYICDFDEAFEQFLTLKIVKDEESL